MFGAKTFGSFCRILNFIFLSFFQNFISTYTMIKTSKTIHWINKKVIRFRSRSVESKLKISSEPISTTEILFDDYVVFRRPNREVENYMALFASKQKMMKSKSDNSINRWVSKISNQFFMFHKLIDQIEQLTALNGYISMYHL